ncbi:hypothetical protein ABZN20_04480 [Methylococcus sp. ANG]|uniref:hypothetical protein n=1 Tax=unclassified Methylococcus TaxID=2618889 RepID=UPI001C52F64D|nr:hypothetical protein [Methylococcus sp. Mc7]QXP83762.1 hypothetical protein KW115_16660 [Methylococcus sp. Mc7]
MRHLLRCSMLAVTLTLFGCVWLRLLEVKNQLDDFDDHFKVVSTDHFLLEFLHPVLYADDFRELTRMEPTRIETLPKGSRWHVLFEKIDMNGKPDPGHQDLEFVLSFNSKSRLAVWDFPPPFLAAAPPQFLEASLRSLGKGEIFQDQRQLKVDPKDLPQIDAEFPNQARVKEGLGAPALELDHEDGRLWVYRYRVNTPHIEDDEGNRRIALARFWFDPASKTLRKFTGKFIGLKLSIDYRNFLPAKQAARADDD